MCARGNSANLWFLFHFPEHDANLGATLECRDVGLLVMACRARNQSLVEVDHSNVIPGELEFEERLQVDPLAIKGPGEPVVEIESVNVYSRSHPAPMVPKGKWRPMGRRTVSTETASRTNIIRGICRLSTAKSSLVAKADGSLPNTANRCGVTCSRPGCTGLQASRWNSPSPMS